MGATMTLPTGGVLSARASGKLPFLPRSAPGRDDAAFGRDHDDRATRVCR